MLRNVSFVLTLSCVIFMMLFSGCASSTQLGLKFSPNAAAAYKSTNEMIKDFRFEQPNAGKLKEEQTRTFTEMSFTQTIESVDTEGVATASITIDELKVDIINKNENKYSFDSQLEKDKNAPLAKLLGQQYTITIAPDGSINVVDTKEALISVKSGYDRTIAKNILDPKAIADRHSITALPKNQNEMLTVNAIWQELVHSPPGLLAPKTYEKTYALTSINNDIATVTMNATESGEAIEGQKQSGGMSMFAKMFDNKDSYTGMMKMDTATGQVLQYEETLISTYIAEEMPENGDPEKGPDTLTMQFTNRIQLEQLK